MNATTGLGMLNNTLRIAIYCGNPNLFFKPDPSGFGVAWHGSPAWDFANMRSRLGLEYEIKTEFPESTYADLFALIDGVADVSIDFWEVNYDMSTVIDYSYPQVFTGAHILSGVRKGFSHADSVLGVFDDTSFGLLIVALVAMILITWLLLKKENMDCSILTCALYIFESAMYKGLNGSIVPRSWCGRAIMTLFTIYNLTLNLMYLSLITSLLISGSKPPQIDSLADLNKEENKDVRIYSTFSRTGNMLRGFEHRVDGFTANIKIPDIIESMLNGSHVLITDLAWLHYIICNDNKDANKTITKLNDFRKSR